MVLVAGSLLSPSQAAPKTQPAYVVVDADSGAVLAHRAANKLWYPASTTKIMTAYVVFRAMAEGKITPRSPVKISQNALNEPPSKMGFKVGTVMTIDNAMKMMMVKSANDIAVAIGEAVAGTEQKFIRQMNAEAKRLGMNSTRFVNPNGLPGEGQKTTARDLAVLSRAVWNEFPQYREYFKIPAIRVGKKVLRNYNTLLERYRGANGMKTGYICASGYNLVGSATRNGRTLMVVVLGSPSGSERAELAASLLTRGFTNWLNLGGRPDIDTFRVTAAGSVPANLRQEMCSAEARQARAEAAKVKPATTALEPRFVLMDPVRVYTGGVAVPAKNVPLPRLRPDRADKSASLQSDAATVR